MLTYVGINLTTKKFQVGSTTDFERRYNQHLKSEDNPEFHNSLRKDPSNFFWLVSVDDETDNREEEQYYLDFYHGSLWCYNLNPSATSPPNRKGEKWSEESKAKHKMWQQNLRWVNDGNRSFRVPLNLAAGYEQGRGKCYNNGLVEKISLNHPGEGWTEGQLDTHKRCPETRKQCGSKNGKSLPIYLKHLDWECEIYYECVSQACKDHGLQKANLCGVLKGKRNHHKGFTARYADPG
jgi:group I intron endonuclease